jgi:hypothetical protein
MPMNKPARWRPQKKSSFKPQKKWKGPGAIASIDGGATALKPPTSEPGDTWPRRAPVVIVDARTLDDFNRVREVLSRQDSTFARNVIEHILQSEIMRARHLYNANRKRGARMQSAMLCAAGDTLDFARRRVLTILRDLELSDDYFR